MNPTVRRHSVICEIDQQRFIDLYWMVRTEDTA